MWVVHVYAPQKPHYSDQFCLYKIICTWQQRKYTFVAVQQEHTPTRAFSRDECFSFVFFFSSASHMKDLRKLWLREKQANTQKKEHRHVLAWALWLDSPHARRSPTRCRPTRNDSSSPRTCPTRSTQNIDRWKIDTARSQSRKTLHTRN